MQAMSAAKPHAFATGKVRPEAGRVFGLLPVVTPVLPEWNGRVARYWAAARG